MKKALFGLTLVSLASFAVACTVVNTKTDDPSNAKPASATDAGTGDADATTSAGGTGKTGSITLSESSITVGEATVLNYTATASFSDGVAAGAKPTTPSCETASEGTCVVSVCDIPDATDAGATDAGTPKAPPNAGTIEVEALESFSLLVNEDTGAYGSANGQKKLWDSGGPIKITAAGDTVPAFAKTLDGPPIVKLTKPALPALGTKYEIDSALAIELTWDDAGAGTLTVSASAVKDKKSSTLSCTFDANAGTATIPQSLVAKLVKGDGFLSVNASTVASVKAGDYAVGITAVATAASSTITVK